jgi:hypothetical protein
LPKGYIREARLTFIREYLGEALRGTGKISGGWSGARWYLASLMQTPNSAGRDTRITEAFILSRMIEEPGAALLGVSEVVGVSINETYIPTKGFEKLFEALMHDYKRELKAILKDRLNEDQRQGESFKVWMDRIVAATAARIDALDEKFKPKFRAVADVRKKPE